MVIIFVNGQKSYGSFTTRYGSQASGFTALVLNGIRSNRIRLILTRWLWVFRVKIDKTIDLSGLFLYLISITRLALRVKPFFSLGTPLTY